MINAILRKISSLLLFPFLVKNPPPIGMKNAK
jgi:hypothetical protein